MKLILKVATGNSSTPEYASSESPPVYGGIQPDSLGLLMDYPERHKKSKKKKKKKDREKKHKHHKEKRRHREESNTERTENEHDESSQENFSINDDSVQFQSDSTLRYNPLLSDSASPASISVTQTPLLTLPMKSPVLDPLANEPSPSVSSVRSDSLKSPSSTSDSGREARTCVLKVRRKPLTNLLSHLLGLLEKKDTQQFFAWPVSDDIAPGYSNIIATPMDFFTMRSKIDENKYHTLNEFVEDFKLICLNAVQYNQEDTVYHIAAKKLLHIGMKMLNPCNLVRLKPLQIYLQELSAVELGFDLSQSHQENDLHMLLDSADESTSYGVDDVNIAQLEEEVKRQNIRCVRNIYILFSNFCLAILTKLHLSHFGLRTDWKTNRKLASSHSSMI